jgi:SPX domain protein involved in polyphosphate accumulation
MTLKIDNKVNTFRRYEFKYLLPNPVASSIQSNIEHFMTLDPHTSKDMNGSYFVRSQYFENELYTNFYEKVDGMRERHKYRLRTYGQMPTKTNPIFLEKKGRKLERTMKGRIQLDYEHLDLIYNKNFNGLLESFSNHSFIEGFVFDCIRKKLNPMIVIDYKRSPYISEYDTNFRLTFDRNIRASTLMGSTSIYAPPENQYWSDVNTGFCTLEVKFLRRYPPWFRRIIQNYNLRRLSISKFSTGIEARGLAQDTGV